MSSRLAAIALALCLIAAGADATRAGSGPAGATSVIVEWNEKANEVAFAEDQFQTFKGARAYAMTHTPSTTR